MRKNLVWLVLVNNVFNVMLSSLDFIGRYIGVAIVFIKLSRLSQYIILVNFASDFHSSIKCCLQVQILISLLNLVLRLLGMDNVIGLWYFQLLITHWLYFTLVLYRGLSSDCLATCLVLKVKRLSLIGVIEYLVGDIVFGWTLILIGLPVWNLISK